jgi:Sjogren's syndrome/scleroderma autoantigen 1 (Autoantigen p27)
MLQDGCSRCATPLLRDGAGTLLCVACSPQRADAAAATPPPPEPLSHFSPPGTVSREAAAAASASAAAAASAAAVEPLSSAVARTAPRGAHLPQPMLTPPAAYAAQPSQRVPTRGIPRLPAPPADGGNDVGVLDPAAELEATEAAVVASLPGLRERLASARDVNGVRAACEAISAAADSLCALRRAGNAIV